MHCKDAHTCNGTNLQGCTSSSRAQSDSSPKFGESVRTFVYFVRAPIYKKYQDWCTILLTRLNVTSTIVDGSDHLQAIVESQR